MISPHSSSDNGSFEVSNNYANSPSFNEKSFTTCSEQIGFESMENVVSSSLSYESDYTYGLEEPSDEADLYIGRHQNRVETTPNNSKIIISSRQDSYQPEACLRNKFQDYEINVMKSPDSLKKEFNKNQMSSTPTLTVSLSSSMSNNSPNSGHTIKLDPNRNMDVQHWNVHDGPFDIAIIKSSEAFDEAKTQDIFVKHTHETDGNNVGTQTSMIQSSNGACTQEMDGDKSSLCNNTSVEKFSPLRKRKSQVAGKKLHKLMQETRYGGEKKSLKKQNAIQSIDLSTQANDEAENFVSDFDQSLRSITDCEIQCHTNHSSISDMEINQMPLSYASCNNESIISINERIYIQDEFNQMSPYSSGIHKRYLAKSYDLEQCMSELEPMPSLSHSSSKSKYTGKGSKNIKTNVLRKVLFFWISLVIYAVLFYTQYIGMSGEVLEPLMELIQNKSKSVVTVPLIDLSRIKPISRLDQGSEKQYSIFFSNQKEGTTFSDGIAESIDYLVTCKNLKHIHVELDSEATNTLRATTNNLELFSEKVKIWEKQTPNFDFSSRVETQTVLLLDEVMGIYNCDDLDRGFQTWTENPDRLVGFDGFNSKGPKRNGYDIVSTSAAFVHKDYLRSIENHEIFSCEGLGLSILVTALSKSAPLQVKGDRSSYRRNQLLESRKKREADMMQNGQKCARLMMQNFGLVSLPKEEFVYIGATR